MRDVDVREALRISIATSHPKTLLLEEFGVTHGAARIDLLLVSQMLHGYEIKSERDSLRRLEQQARYYSAILDQVTLVVAERHLQKAIMAIPGWWGVLVAHGPPEAITLVEDRTARRNLAVDPLSLARLLWREEALAILGILNCDEGVRSKPRRYVYERLVEVADLDVIHQEVRFRLNSRRAAPTDGRQGSDGG